MTAWWDELALRERRASERDMQKFLCKKQILTEYFTLGSLAKVANLNLAESGLLSYRHLIKLFAKPMLCTALENVCALLLQSRMKYSPLALPLKLGDYQRSLYMNGIRHYDELPRADREVMRSVQEWNTIETSRLSQQQQSYRYR